MDRKEYMREYQRRWIAQRRAEWLEDKVCVICGSNDRLEIDHIDPSQKKRNIGTLWSYAPDNPIRVEELAKCQVLCYTHHKEKTIREANARAQHGRTLYSKGCRCEICYEAQRQHNAQRYAPKALK